MFPLCRVYPKRTSFTEIGRKDVHVVQGRIDRVVYTVGSSTQKSGEAAWVGVGLQCLRPSGEDGIVLRYLLIAPDVKLIALEGLARDKQEVVRLRSGSAEIRLRQQSESSQRGGIQLGNRYLIAWEWHADHGTVGG